MSRSCASCLSVRSASASRCCCASVMSFSRCFLAAFSVTAATITAAPKPEMRPAMTAGHVSAASTMIGGIALDLCGSGGRTLAAAIVTVVVYDPRVATSECRSARPGDASLSSTLPLRVKSDCAQGATRDDYYGRGSALSASAPLAFTFAGRASVSGAPDTCATLPARPRCLRSWAPWRYLSDSALAQSGGFADPLVGPA